MIQSNELIIQLEEDRKRLEEDKESAIQALEQASNQYILEREEKKKLEVFHYKQYLISSYLISLKFK